MAKKITTGRMKSTVGRHISAHSTRGKLDRESLRERNPPLAEVLDEFVRSKTTRDDQEPTAKDLARVLEARDPRSRLGKALAKLERHLSSKR
jgi:hypothetical protein